MVIVLVKEMLREFVGRGVCPRSRRDGTPLRPFGKRRENVRDSPIGFIYQSTHSNRCVLIWSRKNTSSSPPHWSKDFRRVVTICVSVAPLRFMGPVRCANGDSTALGPHAGAADCFNRPTAIDMAGTVTAGDTSVTFTTLDGQIVSFTDNFTNATFTGTDRNTAQAMKLALKSRELSLSTRPAIRAKSSPH